VLNTPGTIDSDYRGEIKVIIYNHGNENFSINNGDRIAQMILAPVVKMELEEKNFKTNLNLIQTYKSISIAEGMRFEPNNPVFLLKGKK